MTSNVKRTIEHRLKEVQFEENEMPQFAELYYELWRIQDNCSQMDVEVSAPTRTLLAERIRHGIPLLPFSEFIPDWNRVKTLFKSVIDWAARDTESDKLAMEMENQALNRIADDDTLFQEAVEAWYRGHSLDGFANVHGVEAGLLVSTLGAALKPFLRAYSRIMLPDVEQELWRRRYCPVCGGTPDFACLEKQAGARMLLCSRCDTEWLFQRLECPYCGNQDQHLLAFFTDGQMPGLYRLYVCDSCHTYIKAIDLRLAKEELYLPLERTLTLDLDQQARDRGYVFAANSVGWHEAGT